MTELRVLEAITPSRVGGAEVFVAGLCELMPKLGGRPTIFCPAGRPFVRYAADRGLECVTWNTHGKLDPVMILRLASLIRRQRIDVVHTHLSTASLLGAIAARLAHVPSVAHIHGLNTATCFRYSDSVIAVSEAVKHHVRVQGLDESRVRVIHNGVDLRRFRPTPLSDARASLGWEPSVPVFGVFGRLSPEKGQHVALASMLILLREHPRARLLVVGDGHDLEELRLSAAALGIGDSVEFRGFTGDVRPLMSACDAIVAPSLKEGFGLAAVEAMALGRPVVASNVGGLPEIVTPGETGILVVPNDPNALAQALGNLIANPGLVKDMATRARARVEVHFDLDTQMRLVMDHLREAAGPLRPAPRGNAPRL